MTANFPWVTSNGKGLCIIVRNVETSSMRGQYGKTQRTWENSYEFANTVILSHVLITSQLIIKHNSLVFPLFKSWLANFPIF